MGVLFSEVKEVEEGSAEAKKWPVVAADKGEDRVQGSASGTTSSPDAGVSLEHPSSTVSDAPAPPDAKTPSGSSPSKKPATGQRRPAKPKSSLAALAASTKPKKISTLEKSRLDWNNHLASSSSMEEVDELEKNRKGGGYLEKVDFLQRVDERKEEALSAGKRRR